MFTKLIKRMFPTKQADHTDADAKIAALEKEVEELKALLETQSQRPLTTIKEKEKTQAAPVSPKLAGSVQAKGSSSAKAAYFDMVEYFCNGHDDTAVDIIQYRHDGQEISRETFSWSNGFGEVTSEGIWKKANACAQQLILEGIPCREKKAICGDLENKGGMAACQPSQKEIPRSAPSAEEIRDFEIVMQQPLGPFFPKDGPVLIHSLGSWEQDVAEAQRRMDLFFSTAEAFKFARREKQCKGSFKIKRQYDHIFWSEEYFHSHDGWDTRGESATIIRISPTQFHAPSDPHHAKARSLAMTGEQDKSVRLNGWGQITYDQLWNVPEELKMQEEERYYLGHRKFRAKNFLGMSGYFEICWESY